MDSTQPCGGILNLQSKFMAFSQKGCNRGSNPRRGIELFVQFQKYLFITPQ